MDYMYEYSYMMDDELGAAVGIVYIAYYLISFLIAVTGYVLGSLGLYTIAKRRGINHPWISWIPIASTWILGSISDQYRYVTKGQIKNKRKILLALEIVCALVAVVTIVIASFTMADVAMMSMSLGEAEMVSMLAGTMLKLVGVVLLLAVVGITGSVIYYMAMYDVFTSVNPPYSVVFLVLSIIFRFTEPFFLFFNRKKDLGMPPRCDIPVQPLNTQYISQPPVQEPWENVTEE